MTHTYKVDGMTCDGCVANVKRKLEALDSITSAVVSRESGTAKLTMDTHVSVNALQQALGGVGSKYQISAEHEHQSMASAEEDQDTRTWWETYKPILLVFGFILGATLLIQWASGSFNLMQWMRHFMAGFFLVFAFFKFLDLRGFAESYAGYDILARAFFGWGYIYACIELLLGAAYLVNYKPVLTYSVTVVVMSISIVGVVRSVLNKTQIKCACLGTGFNLPMSTVTIVEDGLMIVMGLLMIGLASGTI